MKFCADISHGSKVTEGTNRRTDRDKCGQPTSATNWRNDDPSPNIATIRQHKARSPTIRAQQNLLLLRIKEQEAKIESLQGEVKDLEENTIGDDHRYGVNVKKKELSGEDLRNVSKLSSWTIKFYQRNKTIDPRAFNDWSPNINGSICSAIMKITTVPKGKNSRLYYFDFLLPMVLKIMKSLRDNRLAKFKRTYQRK